MQIRSVQPTDWPAMAAIYQQGIDTGNAMMETQAPPPEAMANAYMASPQLVAIEDAGIWRTILLLERRSTQVGID